MQNNKCKKGQLAEQNLDIGTKSNKVTFKDLKVGEKIKCKL